MKKRTFKAGENIYSVGDTADGIYVVKKGVAEFFVPMDDQELFCGQLKAGDIFGEYACINDSPRLATVRAIEDIELAFLDKDKLLKVFDNPVAADIARLLCDRIEMLFEMVSGARDPFRRSGDDSRTLSVRAGNMVIENEVMRYSVRIEELPFKLTTVNGETVVERNGIEICAKTAKTTPGNCICIKLTNGQLFGEAEFGHGSINKIAIGDAGGIARSQLQAGPNILILGNDQSLARFIITTSLN